MPEEPKTEKWFAAALAGKAPFQPGELLRFIAKRLESEAMPQPQAPALPMGRNDPMARRHGRLHVSKS